MFVMMREQNNSVLLGLSLRLLLALAVSAFASHGHAQVSFTVDGDPIGPNSLFTDNTGGFTAIQSNGDNLGQPAILISLTGQELLTELRVIVFGLPTPDGNLFFDQFDYRLDFWQSDDYFDDADPNFSIDLGNPTNLILTQIDATTIVPDLPFGNAGLLGGDATTYDLHFDLTALPEGGPTQQMIESPLAAGDWVLGFQSLHISDVSGIFRTTGSSATEGPIPLFSRGDSVPRGVLGGQDPNNIFLRWGISVSARDIIPGDFNMDNIVDGNDLAVWNSSFGFDGGADADGDGDSDGADLLEWQRNVDMPLNVESIAGDFNTDSIVDGSDLAIWVDSFGEDGEADTDGDGDSDGADFLVWQRGFATTSGATHSQGDANGDGAINSSDLLAWEQQFGGPAAPLSTSFAVPEPSSLVLVMFAISLIGCLSRKSRDRKSVV